MLKRRTADDLSWLSAVSSSSPNPSAISRIKLWATFKFTRSPACSNTLFMVCKHIKNIAVGTTIEQMLWKINLQN